MGKIDTSNWGEFRIGDLFDAYLSKDDIQPKNIKEGNIPLISSGKENNGIIAFISNDNAKLWNEKTITVDMFGKAFYQNKPYYCVSHGRVNILVPKFKITDNIGKYLTCVIESVTINKYKFTEMCTGKKLTADTIKLPIDSEGNPDWAYMESYMSNIKTTVSDSLTKLQSAKDSHNHKINTTDWESFRIGDLFEIKRPKSRSEKNYTEGNVKYVSSGCVNNGVVKYLEPINDEDLDKGKCITVSPLDGSSFWQADDFLGRGGSGASISMLYNKNLNKYNSQFICSIIKRSADKFNYQDLLCGGNLKNLIIKLPVDLNSEPDWNYMEQYMKNIEEKVKKQINAVNYTDLRS